MKGLTSFGEDSCGRLYATSSSGGVGVVYRLVGAAPTVCPVAGTSAPIVANPIAKGQRAPSRIHLRARERVVARDRRAYLTVTVAPCAGRKGEPVRLRVGRRTVARRSLGRSCKAYFRPRIDHRMRFRATIAADATYLGATSRRLGMRPAVRDLHKRAPGRLGPEAGA